MTRPLLAALLLAAFGCATPPAKLTETTDVTAPVAAGLEASPVPVEVAKVAASADEAAPRPEPAKAKATEAGKPAEPVGSQGAAKAAGGAWDCEKVLYPYGATGEVAYETKGPEAVEKAMRRAQELLVEKHCGRAAACASLRGAVIAQKTGEGGGKVCAMAVVTDADLAAWKRRWLSSDGLVTQLEALAHELLLDPSSTPTRRVLLRRVFIDDIVDGNVPGGPRADWLRLRMEAALARHDAAVLGRPKNWAGGAVPKGYDTYLGAQVISRREEGVPVLEVVWSRVTNERGLPVRRTMPGVVFSANLAPQVDGLEAVPADDEGGVAVKLDAGAGGSLCRGERTQLTALSPKDAYVRVVNLYGREGGLMLFPNPEQPSDRLKANEPRVLGGEAGFEAQPFPGFEAEQFIVLAADTADGFGPFNHLAGFCRLTPAMVRRLRTREGLPNGVRISTTGFRLRAAADCPNAPPPPDPKTVALGLEQLPVCH